MARRVSEDEFALSGLAIFGNGSAAAEPRRIGGRVPPLKDSEKRIFIAYFGETPLVCQFIWSFLFQRNYIPEKGCTHHLLWALMFLKLYSNEHVLAASAGVSEKTFRKWSWRFVKAIAKLKPHLVSLNIKPYLHNKNTMIKKI